MGALLKAHTALKGKTAVIVGGAAGVGRAITLALAESGVNVAFCDWDEESLAKTASEVETLGVKVLAVKADVIEPDSLDAFFDRIESQCERVDFLINVAGGVQHKLFVETTRERNAVEIRLNYGYILDSVRRALPLLRKHGKGGSIVNFTTIEAHRGAAGFAVYAGAKAATTNFTRALAVELGAERIRVNTIVPDSTPSRTSANARGADFMKRYMSIPPEARRGAEIYIPQKKPPSPEELADAVLFLVSDLSRTITGINLPVDGGTFAAMGFLNWPFGDGYGPSPQPETLKRLFADRGQP